MRSEGGARFDRWGRSSWAGGYNTKINHHVCLKIIKLLSSPGIRATHNGLPVVPVKLRATTAKRVRRRRVGFFSRRGFFPHHYSLVIISTFLAHFMLISTFYVRFMLIRAFYADQANYKNSAFNAYHQVNAVLCLSARLMLISRTIWRA